MNQNKDLFNDIGEVFNKHCPKQEKNKTNETIKPTSTPIIVKNVPNKGSGRGAL